MPFSESALVNTHNGELVKILGNFMNRLCKMVQKSCGGKIPDVPTEDIDAVFDFETMRKQIDRLYLKTIPLGGNELAEEGGNSKEGEGEGEGEEGVHRSGFDIQEATRLAMTIFRDANKYLTEKQPWKEPLKSNPAGVRACLRSLLEAAYIGAHYLLPSIPTTALSIFRCIGVRQSTILALSPKFDNLPAGVELEPSFAFFQLTKEGMKLNTSEGDSASKAAAQKEKRKADMARAKAAKKKAKEAARKKQGKGQPEGPLFSKVDIRVGKIVEVWNHPKADKLYCEKIDCGEGEPREIASGLREHYSLEEMQGKRLLVICNLKVRYT